MKHPTGLPWLGNMEDMATSESEGLVATSETVESYNYQPELSAAGG